MAEASVAVGVMAVPLWYQRHVIPRPLAVQVTMSSAPNLTVVGESEVVMVGGAIEKNSCYIFINIHRHGHTQSWKLYKCIGQCE